MVCFNILIGACFKMLKELLDNWKEIENIPRKIKPSLTNIFQVDIKEDTMISPVEPPLNTDVRH